MKKILKISLIAAISTIGILQAKTYHDKTFLMPRSHGQNIAMENATWHKLIAYSDEDAFGGSLQATGFYQDSENEGPVGQYFGIYNYRWDQMQDFIQVSPAGGGVTNYQSPLHPLDVFHSYDSSSAQLADKIILRPSQESWGVNLGYHQKLDQMVKGLFFRVTAPIVHVKNSLGYTSTGGAVNQSISGTSYSFEDYLRGRVQNTSGDNIQAPLRKAKFHNSNSKTAIADIDLSVGYNFLYEKTKRLCMHGILTVPLGNSPQGEYLFEAIAGNGDHWGLGFGLDSCFRVWDDKNSTLDFIAAFNYRHFFRGTEMRTLGVNRTDSTYYGRPDMWSQYKLLGENRVTGLQPAANVLTRDVEVIPGCQFDAMLDLCLTWNKFSLDLGYNLFAKKAENIRVKHWDNNRYALAYRTHQTNLAFNIGNTTNNAFRIINVNDSNGDRYGQLATNPVINPSVATHKLFGGLGYVFTGFQYPLMLSGGGSWEFVTDNDCLRQWAVWGKLGLAF